MSKYGLLYNLRYYINCLYNRKFRNIRYYHKAQVALFGYRYLIGIRELRKDGIKRYSETGKYL